jgi:hypothetical protein
VGDDFIQTLARLNAALAVSVFGSPAQRALVGQLVSGKLPEDEARRVREGLERAARKIAGGTARVAWCAS